MSNDALRYELLLSQLKWLADRMDRAGKGLGGDAFSAGARFAFDFAAMRLGDVIEAGEDSE